MLSMNKKRDDRYAVDYGFCFDCLVQNGLCSTSPGGAKPGLKDGINSM